MTVSVMWILDSSFNIKNTWYGRTAIFNSYALPYEDAQQLHDAQIVDDSLLCGFKERVASLSPITKKQVILFIHLVIIIVVPFIICYYLLFYFVAPFLASYIHTHTHTHTHTTHVHFTRYMHAQHTTHNTTHNVVE